MESGPEDLSSEEELSVCFKSLSLSNATQKPVLYLQKVIFGRGSQFSSDSDTFQILDCYEIDDDYNPKNLAVKGIPELKDSFQYMGHWLNTKDLIRFSLSCRYLCEWTKQEREKRASSRLLELVVQGNQEASMRILQCDSNLLLSTKGNATDYSGKIIQGLTAFQAALCAGDVNMCRMMKRYFCTLPNGLDSLKEQYFKLFPLGIDSHFQAQEKVAFDFSTILTTILRASEDEVLVALSKGHNNSYLHQALNCFRKEFDRCSYNETIFNPWHLYKIFQLYDDGFDATCSFNKRRLIWCQVVGYIQRHLPACYAQDFAQGLYQMSENQENPHRSFNFRFGGESMFPLAFKKGLGFDFASGACGRMDWRVVQAQNIYLMLFQVKKISLEEILQPPQMRPDRWCVVC